jgi:hypothetical protein
MKTFLEENEEKRIKRRKNAILTGASKEKIAIVF